MTSSTSDRPKITKEITDALNRRKATPRGRTGARKRSRRPYDAKADLIAQIAAAGLPAPAREVRFDLARKWRFDFAWGSFEWAPYRGLAVEFEGAVHTGGRHTRGVGFEKDVEKYNAATLARWLLLRCTASQVKSGAALAWIQRALGAGRV